MCARQSSVIREQLVGYFSSLIGGTQRGSAESDASGVCAASLPAAAGPVTVSVSMSDQQLDDSDDEVYFNVTIMRDSEQQRYSDTAQLDSSSKPASSERVLSSAIVASAASPAPSVAGRKRKMSHQRFGPTKFDRATVSVAAVSDEVKRARLSASTKAGRARRHRTDTRPLLSHSGTPNKAATTVASAANRRGKPSAAHSTSSTPLLPPFISSGSTSSIGLAIPPSAGVLATTVLSAPSGWLSVPMPSSAAANSVYAAMMAELDERVTRVSDVSCGPTAAVQTPHSAPPTAATRAAHTIKADRTATSDRSNNDNRRVSCCIHPRSNTVWRASTMHALC